MRRPSKSKDGQEACLRGSREGFVDTAPVGWERVWGGEGVKGLGQSKERGELRAGVEPRGMKGAAKEGSVVKREVK